jgi:hypothetical protein
MLVSLRRGFARVSELRGAIDVRMQPMHRKFLRKSLQPLSPWKPSDQLSRKNCGI